jgi:hypothetical protein
LKLRALIERLEEIEADLQTGLGDDVEPEVVAAIQPSYPLTATIDGVAVLEDEDEPVLLHGRPIVWITTGAHPEGISPYAPRAVFEAAS